MGRQRRISGAATVMAGNVYFATLSRRTFAVDGRTGRQVWSFPDGGTARIFALTEMR